jgi:hypothetical protein
MRVEERDGVEDIDAVVLSSSPLVVHKWHVGRGRWFDDVWERSTSMSFTGVIVDPSLSIWTGWVVSNWGKAAVAGRRWLQEVHCEEVLVAVGVETR